MKNFEKITGNAEILADVVLSAAHNTAQDTLRAIREELREQDFSEKQYRFLTYLLDMIQARNELQKDSARAMYVDWLNQEEQPVKPAQEVTPSGAEETAADTDKPRKIVRTKSTTSNDNVNEDQA